MCRTQFFYIIRSVPVSTAGTIVHTAPCHGNSFFDKQPSLWSATTYNAGTRVQLLLLLTFSHHSLPTFGSSFLLQLIDCLLYLLWKLCLKNSYACFIVDFFLRILLNLSFINAPSTTLTIVDIWKKNNVVQKKRYNRSKYTANS